MNLARTGILLLATAFAFVGCFYDTKGEPEIVDSGNMNVDSGVTGMGTTCEGDEDCADFEATLCVINPMGSDPGYCSLDGCEPGGCPAPFDTCCDCSGLGWVETCMDATNSEMAAGYGCTCD